MSKITFQLGPASAGTLFYIPLPAGPASIDTIDIINTGSPAVVDLSLLAIPRADYALYGACKVLGEVLCSATISGFLSHERYKGIHVFDDHLLFGWITYQHNITALAVELNISPAIRKGERLI